MIRTRFAPSPTGELHIGGVRTALFAYLFAKSKGGEFLLRIEDTDRERLVGGSIERIIESLDWLGIKRDNKKLVIQSERLEEYKRAALELVKNGKAYICTCSKKRLEELRKKQEAEKRPTGYDSRCRNKSEILISKSETNSKLEIQNPKTVAELDSILKTGAVVRMKMPQEGAIKFTDLIRGEVEFDSALLDDQIILKSDGYPTYHLASVVDDHEMNITHVIRAEEWLSSTPKHLVLYEMFGWKAPEFAHLSMILGTDKKKLSKRHGATSVIDYRDKGYLPESLVNFIAFLGWNPKDEREIFSIEELIKEFKLENINKAPAIFNVEKLDSINQQYLQNQISKIKVQNDPASQKQSGAGAEKIKNYLSQFEVKELSFGELELLGRGGYSTLRKMAQEILNLRKMPEYDGKILIFKKSTSENTKKGLKLTIEALDQIDEKDWNNQELQMRLGLIVEKNDLTNGDIFWPVRVALSGKEKSPSPVELAVALGKDESLKRIEKAIKALK